MSDRQEGGAPAEFGTRELVDLYLDQSTAVHQLWTTYVVATFAGGTFAMSAGEQGGVPLLVAGAVGFSAFTIGHCFLLWTSLTRMKLAAEDLRERSAGAEATASIGDLARPVNRWGGFVCHTIIDLCVLGAFVDRIAAVEAAARASVLVTVYPG
jgi:hypothetical protein